MNRIQKRGLNPNFFKLVLTLCCLSSFNSSALTNKQFGLETGPSWGYQNINSTKLANGFHAGLIFQFELYKRLSIKTGVNYFKSGISNEGFCLGICTPPAKTTNYFHRIEIPINIYLDTSSDPKAKTKLFLYAGYSIGEVFQEQYYFEFDNLPSETFTTESGLLKTVHFLNLGFDVRRDLGQSYHLSLGGDYKQTAMYYDRFGTTRSIQINIRLTKSIQQ